MELYARIACDMPIELMRKGIGWQDRAIYTEAALFCRKELTDGVIERSLLGLWMIDLAPDERAARLDALVTFKALKKHKDGWKFPAHVWAKWGVLKADVDAKRAAEAQRKAEYREKMSQRDKDGTVADVRTCPDTSESKPQSESKPEPKTKTKPAAAPADPPQGSTRAPFTDHPAAAAALELFIKHREGEYQPDNPTGFRLSMRRDEARAHGPAMAAFIDENPAADARDMLEAVFGLSELTAFGLTGQARRSA